MAFQDGVSLSLGPQIEKTFLSWRPWIGTKYAFPKDTAKQARTLTVFHPSWRNFSINMQLLGKCRMHRLEVALSNRQTDVKKQLMNEFVTSNVEKFNCRQMNSSTRVAPSAESNIKSKHQSSGSLLIRTVLFVSIHLVFVATGLLLYST